MAFLNDLDEKITAIGKSAIGKTKSMTDSVRASASINEEQKRIKQNYASMGKLFVQQNPIERESGAYQEMYNHIVASEEKLKNLYIQKSAAVNTMNCSKCGATIPQDSVFCNSCGASLNQEPEKPQEVPSPVQQGNRCSKCGGEITVGQEFCINCGTRVERGGDLEATELVNLTQQQTPVQNENRCPNCNAELKADQAFCMQCGTKR